MTQNKLTLITERLKELIPKQNIYHSKLFEAASYSLDSKGKRLRPLLTLYIVEALKKDISIALDPAIAIELIHTYSLIHDDLPCMDDDDIRRGKPSLHKAYPEWLAILTGDYLLTYTFEIISNAKDLEDKQKLSLIKALSKYSGGNGLIAGQVADLSWEGENIDLDKLKFMHLNKTTKLFMASAEFGCIIAKADNETTTAFIEFAKNFGLAFQFYDDISDALDEKKSSDIIKKKATAVSILGLEKAKEMACSYKEKAKKCLKKLSVDISNIEKLLNFGS